MAIFRYLIVEPELMRIKTPPIAKDSPELVNCEQPVEAVGAKSQSAVIGQLNGMRMVKQQIERDRVGVAWD